MHVAADLRFILSLRLAHLARLLLAFALHIFFFNDTAATEIYTLSLHDALPIWTAKKGGRKTQDSVTKAKETEENERKRAKERGGREIGRAHV